MSIEMIAIIAAGVLVGIAALLLVMVRIPKKLKPAYFVSQWKELQKYCKDKKTWPEAIIAADGLLDRALKKRKFKGKTMGERMVSAQRIFTDNDGAWFAHNIYKKLKADPNFNLKESDVRDALVCFRQALRDIGALPEENKQDQALKVKK